MAELAVPKGIEMFSVKFVNRDGPIVETQPMSGNSYVMYRDIGPLLEAIKYQLSRFGWGAEIVFPPCYRKAGGIYEGE